MTHTQMIMCCVYNVYRNIIIVYTREKEDMKWEREIVKKGTRKKFDEKDTIKYKQNELI